MASRLVASRADVARCWSNTARLQQAAGKIEEARNSREVAARVRGINAWVGSR